MTLGSQFPTRGVQHNVLEVRFHHHTRVYIMKRSMKQIDFSRVFALAGLSLALLVGRSLAQPQPALPSQAKAGLGGSPARETFVSRCASCHGLDGRGGEHAPDIVTSPSVRSRSDQSLFDVITHGLPRAGMPAFGQLLSPAEIRALVGYLRDAGKNGEGPAATGDAAKGRALFFGKAGCGQCHMIGGEGGFLGRDLSDFGRHHSPAQIRVAILRPNDRLLPGQEALLVTTREGQRWEGVIRNEDNFSLQLLDPKGVFHLVMKSELASLERQPKSLMPDDYSSRLTASEVDALAGYIAGSKR
jgi:putative heme-binding domain-containing protein